MPEGDTIYRAARTMHRALEGRVVTGFTTQLAHLHVVHDQASLVGRTILKVEAQGKHNLIHFSGELALRTHMRMNGSWHLYRPGEKWFRPARNARVVIVTEAFVAVGFNVPVAEFLDGADALLRQEDLRKMGPDLLRDPFDEAEAVARIRGRGAEPIADVLLNQRVVAGLGNVYKSETLFMMRLSPFAPAGEVAEEMLVELLTLARKLLRANVHDGATEGITTYRGLRRTTGRADPGERTWVYGRRGAGCRKCGTLVEYRKTGPNARSTYWCPGCQPAPKIDAAPGPAPGPLDGPE